MADDIQRLFEQNRAWTARIEKTDPGFFKRLSKGQSPKYLWIGCADSRVPETQLLGLEPGGVFVHRNVANVVLEEDINCMSVIQFAVEVLKVRHIIVCGHYGCAGIKAGMDQNTEGPVDLWLTDMRRLYDEHKDSLSELDPIQAQSKMCELNVQLGVRTIADTATLRDAWARGQRVNVHGWVYDLRDGRIKDLDFMVASSEQAVQLRKNQSQESSHK